MSQEFSQLDYFRTGEKLFRQDIAIRTAEVNLADEQIARFLRFVTEDPVASLLIDVLKGRKAYQEFSPEDWYSKEYKRGTGFSIDEMDGLSERYKVLDWISKEYQKEGEISLWQAGAKLYHRNDSSVVRRLEQAITSIYQPVHDYLDMEIREQRGQMGEEPMFGTPELVNEEETEERKRSVFVVHGRNLHLRDAMFKFLRAVDLRPIEWSQARAMTGKPSPYVGEILDAAFSNAQAVIVIFSPEDLAYLHPAFQKNGDGKHEKEPTMQARPNVLFEAGMAMGRNQNRTVFAQFGEIRPFSDIAGRHMLFMDNSPEKRKELTQRLRDAGCTLNTDGEDWLTEGEFGLEELDIPISPLVGELSENEHEFLRVVALLYEEHEAVYRSRLQSTLGLKVIEFEYIRNKLIDVGLIGIVPDENEILEDSYCLTEAGIKFAVENGLMQ